MTFIILFLNFSCKKDKINTHMQYYVPNIPMSPESENTSSEFSSFENDNINENLKDKIIPHVQYHGLNLPISLGSENSSSEFGSLENDNIDENEVLDNFIQSSRRFVFDKCSCPILKRDQTICKILSKYINDKDIDKFRNLHFSIDSTDIKEWHVSDLCQNMQISSVDLNEYPNFNHEINGYTPLNVIIKKICLNNADLDIYREMLHYLLEIRYKQDFIYNENIFSFSREFLHHDPLNFICRAVKKDFYKKIVFKDNPFLGIKGSLEPQKSADYFKFCKLILTSKTDFEKKLKKIQDIDINDYINIQTSDYPNLLYVAICMKNCKAFSALLNMGADPNKEFWIRGTNNLGRLDCMKYLEWNYYNDDSEIFYDFIEKLLDKNSNTVKVNIDINFLSNFNSLTKKHSYDILKLIYKYDKVKVRRLLKNDIDIKNRLYPFILKFFNTKHYNFLKFKNYKETRKWLTSLLFAFPCDSKELKYLTKPYCNYNKKHKFDTSKKLKLCKQCREIYYCSKSCQKKDWKNHKEYCIAHRINHLILREIKKGNEQFIKKCENNENFIFQYLHVEQEEKIGRKTIKRFQNKLKSIGNIDTYDELIIYINKTDTSELAKSVKTIIRYYDCINCIDKYFHILPYFINNIINRNDIYKIKNFHNFLHNNLDCICMAYHYCFGGRKKLISHLLLLKNGFDQKKLNIKSIDPDKQIIMNIHGYSKIKEGHHDKFKENGLLKRMIYSLEQNDNQYSKIQLLTKFIFNNLLKNNTLLLSLSQFEKLLKHSIYKSMYIEYRYFLVTLIEIKKI